MGVDVDKGKLAFKASEESCQTEVSWEGGLCGLRQSTLLSRSLSCLK